MPLHVAEPLRSVEAAAEAAGLLISLDSDGVTIQKALEAASEAPKNLPLVTYLFNGNSYTPS